MNFLMTAVTFYLFLKIQKRRPFNLHQLIVSRQKLRILPSACGIPPLFGCFRGVSNSKSRRHRDNPFNTGIKHNFSLGKIISWGRMTLTGISIAIPKISQSPLLSKIPQMNFFNTQITPKSLSITVPRFLSNLEFRRFLGQDPEILSWNDNLTCALYTCIWSVVWRNQNISVKLRVFISRSTCYILWSLLLCMCWSLQGKHGAYILNQ